jgi:hypothetical protein
MEAIRLEEMAEGLVKIHHREPESFRDSRPSGILFHAVWICGNDFERSRTSVVLLSRCQHAINILLAC